MEMVTSKSAKFNHFLNTGHNPCLRKVWPVTEKAKDMTILKSVSRPQNILVIYIYICVVFMSQLKKNAHKNKGEDKPSYDKNKYGNV